jgi:glutamine cyclotransferase
MLKPIKLNSFYFFSILFLLAACKSNTNNSNTEDATTSNAIVAPTNLNYAIVKVYPHDTTSYTQGLEWDGNNLIEGTGNYGKSLLHVLDTQMKSSKGPIKLAAEFFGEGTTLFNGKIYQLTWKENKVFVYDAKTLKKTGELYWPYEGWGLTHNDTSLIVSTGGSNLYFVNPLNFSIQKTIGVFDNYGYTTNINELEWVNGKIFANIYYQDKIVVIDPMSGSVTSTMDMSNILAQAGVKYNPRTVNDGYVLNGIAYKTQTKTLFVTGKCWPVMVEITLK